MRSIKFTALLSFITLLLFTIASAQTKQTSSADKKFVKEAAEGGMAEVQLGQLAVKNASSESVKQFGQRMIDDHSKANDKLKSIATSKEITLPTEPSAKDREVKDHLAKLSGKQFDEAYMSDMLKDHRTDIAEFQHESTAGSDPQIKGFAKETLPTLKSHLSQAEKVAPSTKMTQGTH